jgi:DNA-binding response OmpR family regulator
LLVRRAGEAISRDEFLDAIWGADVHVTHRTVDTHVSALRRKIEPEPESPVYIVGVRGVGYRFEGTFAKS